MIDDKAEDSPVPVVDLAVGEEAAARVCRAACESAGFFYLQNHGVPDSLIQRHDAAQARFFALPVAAKETILADANNRGWTPLEEETLDPAASVAGDAKEGLYYCREVAPDSAEAALPLHGPNQWPAEALLPGYRAVVEEYISALRALGMRMLRVVALSLGLPPDHFDAAFTRPMFALRPLHYVARRSDEAGGRFACGAHTDYGFLTLLHAPSPGLQIWETRSGSGDGGGGRWRDVPPKEGAFVVNLGDMLQRWTNGRYRSTLHRVINPRGAERYSCAFFFEPNFDTVVAALPACVGEGEAPRWPPVTSGQHLLDKYAATHAGYAASTQGAAA